ncbi:MAG: hypothetical protein L0206_10980, partial [Actinobacteria bacterium]|nr:hypothetical protein [Actinomycetota bacterium]
MSLAPHLRRMVPLVIAVASFGSASAQDPDYQLDLTDATGTVGDIVTLIVTLSSTADEVTAFQFDVCNDASIAIGFGDVEFGPALEEADFSTHTITYEDEGWSVAAALETGTLPAGGELLDLYLAEYELLVEGISEPYFCGAFRAPRLTTVGLEEVEPETGVALVVIGAPIVFPRGDVNGDGRVDAIFDTDHLMGFLFVGTREPPCFDAADVDNNGLLNITDAVRLLGWGLLGGDPPETPGPDTCGVDPEGGDLGCETPPAPCPGLAPRLDVDPSLVFTVTGDGAPVEVDENTTVAITLSIDGDPI